MRTGSKRRGRPGEREPVTPHRRTPRAPGRRTGAGPVLGRRPVGSPVGDSFGPASYGHTGFTGTSLWIDPEAGRYAILLTNRVHPSREERGFAELRRDFHTIGT
nr:beta-lactamase family protein [Streptomyces sp. NBC_00995]